MADGRRKTAEATDIKVVSEANRKKQGRGRGSSGTGRGRGSKANDQIRSLVSPTIVPTSNGHLENLHHMVRDYVPLTAKRL